MNKNYPRSPYALKRKVLGFSLVESMVAILLGLFLTAGLLSIFVSSKRATNEAVGSGERQENAHFAMQLLGKDLKHAYFFAQATGENKELWNLNSLSVSQSSDCVDDAGSASLPSNTLYRPLWASSVPSALGSLKMDCIVDDDSDTSLVTNSDYISIKRARGLQQEDDFSDDRFYLDINTTALDLYEGDANELTNRTVTPVWEYMHHVYYLDSEAGVGQFRRLTLRTAGMELEEVLVEGVENMQFMFALDALVTDERDGSVDSFVGTDEVTSNDWSSGRVIGMKVFLLIKALQPTVGYSNTNSYQMGDHLVAAANDNYKRELVSTVILFQNSVVAMDE